MASASGIQFCAACRSAASPLLTRRVRNATYKQFAGGASDLYPSGPALLPGHPGIGPGGMLIGLRPLLRVSQLQPSACMPARAHSLCAGPRNFPNPLGGGPHFGIPAPGSGAPRFDPYGPPDLHVQPQVPRNYGDAFAPPQPTNDLFPPPGGGMRLPHMGGGRGGAFPGMGGRGGGSLGPFGGGGFI